MIRDLEGLEKSIGFVSQYLDKWADLACLDIAADKSMEAWPQIITFNQFNGVCCCILLEKNPTKGISERNSSVIRMVCNPVVSVHFDVTLCDM